MNDAASLALRVRAAFADALGGAPTLVARAPGRVNLIGEHTDYNDGFVLPCAIGFQTLVAARRITAPEIRVVAADWHNGRDTISLNHEIAHDPARPWAEYVRAMVWALQHAGVPLCGAELLIAGDVPQGAGLSSSASLHVALGQAFLQLQGLDEPASQALALLAQRAENEFVGCQCGVMDQLASACGSQGHALLIDCRSLQVQPVPLPTGTAVLVAHSRVERGLVGSEYNLRRQQCEAAARHFGVPALRDLSLAQWEQQAAGLDSVTLRRARHVVSENARTLAAAQALATGDLHTMGRLMQASHASMRDDFEITVPAIDELVAILQTAIGAEGGARMTGGGFGGCVVALMPEALAPAAMAAVQQHYRSPHGLPATLMLCQAAAGSTEQPLV